MTITPTKSLIEKRGRRRPLGGRRRDRFKGGVPAEILRMIGEKRRRQQGGRD